RIFAGGDTPKSDQFLAGDPVEAYHPGVAADAQGNFIVIWEGPRFPREVRARSYDADGNALGPTFRVNTNTAIYGIERPAVAMNRRGEFVITWESGGSASTDASDFSVQARRFAASGAAVSDQFQVNTYTTGNQSEPAVAMDGKGRFVIA